MMDDLLSLLVFVLVVITSLVGSWWESRKVRREQEGEADPDFQWDWDDEDVEPARQEAYAGWNEYEDKPNKKDDSPEYGAPERDREYFGEEQWTGPRRSAAPPSHDYARRKEGLQDKLQERMEDAPEVAPRRRIVPRRKAQRPARRTLVFSDDPLVNGFIFQQILQRPRLDRRPPWRRN